MVIEGDYDPTQGALQFNNLIMMRAGFTLDGDYHELVEEWTAITS